MNSQPVYGLCARTAEGRGFRHSSPPTQPFPHSQIPAAPLPCTDSGEIEAIEIHHLAPCGREVFHKRLLRVVTCIHFRYRSELGVRTEEEIDARAGPLEFVSCPVAPL